MAGRIARLRTLAGNETGAISMVAGLFATMFVGLAALAVETGLWYATKRNLQTAADAAALAGALELYNGNTFGYGSVAVNEATRNGADAQYVLVNSPPGTGSYTGTAVEVKIDQPVDMLFAQVLIQGPVVIHVRSVAQVGTTGSGDYCILALEDTESEGFKATGSSVLDAPNCHVAVNSSHSTQALVFTGSTTITIGGASVVGGADGADPGDKYLTQNSGGVTTGQSPMTDPYADVGFPVYGSMTCKSKTSFGKKDGPTITPGRYCGGLSFTSQANITFMPGVYIIDGGDFTVHGQAQIRGEGVTIAMTGGQVHINGGAVVDFTAPTSGDYSGLVFFKERTASESTVNRFNGGAAMAITGALYFPSQIVEFSGNSDSGQPCTHIIARKVEITGNSDVGSSCEGTGVQTIGQVRPRLVD